jgi:hypothetical protein
MLAIAFAAGNPAQEAELERLLNRLSDYLERYEQSLSALVADESYEQRVIRPLRRPLEMDATGLPVFESPRPTAVEDTRRRLQSTIWFMRLPGGAAWLGTRAVRMIDNQEMADAERLLLLLRQDGRDAHTQAAAIVHASAQHNLGNPRSVNMPTLPLELLDRRHRERMTFTLSGRQSIRGIKTTRVTFVEKGTPTLIRGESDGRWVISRGVVWIDDISGSVWRAQVFYRDYSMSAPVPGPEGEIDVEFVRNNALDMVVPSRMREVFLVNSGRGEGEAKYSNYRRFTTSGRVLPSTPR